MWWRSVSMATAVLMTCSSSAVAIQPVQQESKDPEQKEAEKQKETRDSEELALRLSERVNVIGGAERLFDIPGSAFVLDEDEMERQKQGFDDVHRMLRQVPGVVVQEEEGFGLRPNIGMRGTGSERSAKITLMEDGVIIAPAPYAAPSAYYFPVAGRMQSIEVRKGSSQIRFGPRTNGGALNLVSTAVPTAFRLYANVAAGQHSARKAHVNVGDSYRNVGWMFETYQFGTNGFKDLDGGGDTGYYVQDYVGKLRVFSSPESAIFQSLELKVEASKEDSSETYLGLTDGDFDATSHRRYAASQPDNITWDHQQYQLQHFLAIPSGFDLTTTFYRNNFARNWYKLQSISGVGLSRLFENPLEFRRELDIARGATSRSDELQVRANNRSYYGMGIQSVAGFAAATGSAAHDLEVGFRYHQDEEDRFQHQDGWQMVDGTMNRTTVGAPGSYTNRLSDASAFAIFAQDTIEWSRFTLIPGVRYETIDLTRTDYARDDLRRTGPTRFRENAVAAFIPGVGFRFDLQPSWRLLGGIHKGFSPPGPGSPEEARAEASVNYEVGVRHQQNTMAFEVLVFYNDYQNLLGVDTLSSGGTGEGDLFNGGRARIHGVEASFNYDFTELSEARLSFPFQLTWSYTDAEFRDSFESTYEPWGDVEAGDKLPYLPQHQFYTAIAVEDERWMVGVTAHYNSRMRTEAGQGPIPTLKGTDSFFIWNASAHYGITDSLRIFASLQNIGNNTYIVARRPAGARPGLPRTFLMGVKFQLGS